MNSEGREFESALSKFLNIFYSDKNYDEDTFSEVFDIEDKVVDFCFFYEREFPKKKKILLLQAKYKSRRNLQKAYKIRRRLEKVRDALQLHFPDYEIEYLLVVVKKQGKIIEPLNDRIDAESIVSMLVKLRDFLIRKEYLSEEEYFNSLEKFEGLLTEYYFH